MNRFLIQKLHLNVVSWSKLVMPRVIKRNDCQHMSDFRIQRSSCSLLGLSTEYGIDGLEASYTEHGLDFSGSLLLTVEKTNILSIWIVQQRCQQRVKKWSRLQTNKRLHEQFDNVCRAWIVSSMNIASVILDTDRNAFNGAFNNKPERIRNGVTSYFHRIFDSV